MSSFTIASIKSQFDEVRAQVYPRNETEKKVYEAVSSKNWGASTTLMVLLITLILILILLPLLLLPLLLLILLFLR